MIAETLYVTTSHAAERFVARSLPPSPKPPRLLGYRPFRCACPGVELYVHAGLRPVDTKNIGLDGYPGAVGRTWLTSWGPDQQAEQARYLIGMITAARRGELAGSRPGRSRPGAAGEAL